MIWARRIALFGALERQFFSLYRLGITQSHSCFGVGIYLKQIPNFFNQLQSFLWNGNAERRSDADIDPYSYKWSLGYLSPDISNEPLLQYPVSEDFDA